MRRRDILKSALAAPIALAAPFVARAQGSNVLKFIPHADLVSVDPVWTTADITRNYSLAVLDTLYGLDAKFQPQPQMVAGHAVSSDHKQWDLTLRDGLKFHDGTPVLARDCVATIQRWSKRAPLGVTLMRQTDELTAVSDKQIRFRLKRPFPLLPFALSGTDCGIMPERLAKTDAFSQVSEPIGSGPFRFNTAERVSGSRAVFDKNEDYVPRPDGIPSFQAGPKIVYFDRIIWQTPPDPATCAAALMNNEIDWWENPTIDLVPQLRQNKSIAITVKDITGEIGCLRFNHLYPPFNNAAIRRLVLRAVDQREFMQAYAGAVPELIKTDVGIFVPGTPLASTEGVEITRGDKDVEKLKKQIVAAGYAGEKVVLLGATTIPSIDAIAKVAGDLLQRLGFNLDYQALEWGTVVQRRASKEPIDKGGWNVFMTYLGGNGNISPAGNVPLRGSGDTAWFGWPVDPKMEQLRDAWFEAEDLAGQQAICREMQKQYFEQVPYVALGMYDSPTGFWSYLKDVRDGYPQFYGVRRA
jgi:peptide/nickel transport system substrate-binding protein